MKNTKRFYNLGLPAKETLPGPMHIYVGISETSPFLRSYEERAWSLLGEDLSYHVFHTNFVPTKKSHSQYNAVIGPFRTMEAALIFRDRAGINSVEEAERLVRCSIETYDHR